MRILFWFRKDLRLDDNAGLHQAARDAAGNVVPFYASDPAILGRDDIAATRVRFVLDSLADLSASVAAAGSRLALAHGDPAQVVLQAARACGADAVYWNDEYEPALRARDEAVARALSAAHVAVRRFGDRLLVPPGMVANAEGRPFVVYTPFRRACERLPLGLPLPAVTRLAPHDLPDRPLATLERLGFATVAERWPGGASEARRRLARFVGAGARHPHKPAAAGGEGGRDGGESPPDTQSQHIDSKPADATSSPLARYAAERDFPAADAHSRLSADLKFGTISPRQIVAAVQAAVAADPRLAAAAERLVAELRWRDFYAHVLWHFPHVEHGAFRRELDALAWEGDPAHFVTWQEGRTGYPIVDAGMRQLAATGFMHNRVRMIVASFLTKDLLLDWRLGERHFMRHLVDGDLASNNGGWQWAASTGTDAQPWFRIFNPTLQGEKFDPDGGYVRRWVPELAAAPAAWIHRPWEATPAALANAGLDGGGRYPRPIVDHAERRERALAMYGRAGKAAGGAGR